MPDLKQNLERAEKQEEKLVACLKSLGGGNLNGG
jgi:hypothetical protein